MNAFWSFLDKAKESLNAAELLWNNQFIGFSASRAHYAYLYTAQALLLSRGLEFSRHGQVIAQYGFHFSRTRLLDPEYHRLFATAFDLRHAGDYAARSDIDVEDVKELIEKGRRFVADAARYLAELAESAEAGEGGEA